MLASRPFASAALFAAIAASASMPCAAQYTDGQAFNDLGGAKEFAARRAELGKACGHGMVVLFAREHDPEAANYREDNDFYYYTGIADPGSILVMDCELAQMAGGIAFLFEVEQQPRIAQVYGPNVLSLPASEQAKLGWWKPEKMSLRNLNPPKGNSVILPLPMMDQLLTAMLAQGDKPTLWLREGYADKADGARIEPAEDAALDYSRSYAGMLPMEMQRIQLIRSRYPAAETKDITPMMDAMRNIKRPGEIAVLRRVGKLSAEGNAYAISKAHPGVMQYEVEANATWYYRMHGAQGISYPAIVGSGADANTWHYFSDRHPINAGDVVVFDYAASLHHECMDITRTFPIDGKFTPEEAKWYDADLEAQETMIKLLKPGNTWEQVEAAGEAVYKKYGIDDQWLGYPGHFVGLATHDVLSTKGKIKAGQVVTVEPIIEFPDKHWHFRVEDTILITDNGPENLSAAVPKDRASIETLVNSAPK